MYLEEFSLNLPDVRLRYRTTTTAGNDSPTLIFLHYFGGSSRTWLPVIDRLADDHPCLAVDLRGSGDSVVNTSTATTPTAYSLDAMAGDVAALVGALGIRRYVLVGHSMGGKVALAVAAGRGCPSGLAALVLLAPSPPSPEPMPDAERARLLAALGSESAVRETLARITFRPLAPAQTDAAVADQLRVAPAAWRAWLESGSRQDITARLERLKVPVFLAAGEKDANLTPKLLRRALTDALPAPFSREPETIPDAAHLLPLEAPQAVADFIRRALAA